MIGHIAIAARLLHEKLRELPEFPPKLRAMVELAFESAAKHYDRSLGALELVDAPDGSVRCELQLAVATAYFNGGDERTREAVFQAGATARMIGDGPRLARAALILTSGVGTSDARVDPEGPKGPDAAPAEQGVLRQPEAAVADVQP